MLRILIISLFLVGTILIFSYLTTYLVKKFGRLIAISSIISVGIILSAIIIAHEDGCLTEVEGLEATMICWFK
jgi:formate hydrogenlyase subunit 3/multisubunit Na+/H+ antiporter MnhD subunit